MNRLKNPRGRPAFGLMGALLALALLAACGNGEDIRALPEAGGISGVAAISASASGTTVTLSWPTIPEASGYTLYWSTSPGVTPGTGTPIPVAAPPYLHSGLLEGTTYYYVLTADLGGTESPASGQASAVTIPPTPTGLVASPTSRRVTLTWDPTPGASTYNLYWLPTSGVTTGTGIPIPNVTSGYQHTGRHNDSAHYYILTASNAAGTSAATGQVFGQTPLPNVALFFDGSYGDTTPGQESEGMLASIQGILGYPVLPFAGTAPGTFSAALAGMDVLVIPELTGNLDTALGTSRSEIANFVSSGNTLVVSMPSSTSMQLLNNTFGFGMAPTGWVTSPYPIGPDALGTIFEGGPPSLPYLSAVGTIALLGLPPTALRIYTDSGGPVVTMIPFGTGRIVVLGWDWFSASAVGNPTPDGPWLDVLWRAVRL